MATQPRLGSFPSQKTASNTWWLDANSSFLFFVHSNSGLFSLGTQPRFWAFYRRLVLPPFQDTCAHNFSHQVLSSSRQIFCPFFQGGLLRFSALSVSWVCYKSFRLVAVLSYSNLSVPYLSPEMIKKYLNILNPRKKMRCQTKNTSSLLSCECMTPH